MGMLENMAVKQIQKEVDTADLDMNGVIDKIQLMAIEAKVAEGAMEVSAATKNPLILKDLQDSLASLQAVAGAFDLEKLEGGLTMADVTATVDVPKLIAAIKQLKTTGLEIESSIDVTGATAGLTKIHEGMDEFGKYVAGVIEHHKK